MTYEHNEHNIQRLKIALTMIVLWFIVFFALFCLYNFVIFKENTTFNTIDDNNNKKLKPKWGHIIGYSLLSSVILSIILLGIGEIQVRNTKRYGRCDWYTIYKLFGGGDVFCDED